jgi:hypothetical protein
VVLIPGPVAQIEIVDEQGIIVTELGKLEACVPFEIILELRDCSKNLTCCDDEPQIQIFKDDAWKTLEDVSISCEPCQPATAKIMINDDTIACSDEGMPGVEYLIRAVCSDVISNEVSLILIPGPVATILVDVPEKWEDDIDGCDIPVTIGLYDCSGNLTDGTVELTVDVGYIRIVGQTDNLVTIDKCTTKTVEVNLYRACIGPRIVTATLIDSDISGSDTINIIPGTPHDIEIYKFVYNGVEIEPPVPTEVDASVAQIELYARVLDKCDNYVPDIMVKWLSVDYDGSNVGEPLSGSLNPAKYAMTDGEDCHVSVFLNTSSYAGDNYKVYAAVYKDETISTLSPEIVVKGPVTIGKPLNVAAADRNDDQGGVAVVMWDRSDNDPFGGVGCGVHVVGTPGEIMLKTRGLYTGTESVTYTIEAISESSYLVVETQAEG